MKATLNQSIKAHRFVQNSFDFSKRTVTLPAGTTMRIDDPSNNLGDGTTIIFTPDWTYLVNITDLENAIR